MKINYFRELQNHPFAGACYDMNSWRELLESLAEPAADKTDCGNWGITPTEWRASIRIALGAMIQDLEERLDCDPCGGRDCDTCEIGGCDHGAEVR